jgi:hypoxanthine phosphoribosyltransferase
MRDSCIFFLFCPAQKRRDGGKRDRKPLTACDTILPPIGLLRPSDGVNSLEILMDFTMNREDGTFRVEPVSWEKAVSLSALLSGLIKKSGYHPDLVVAIGRGGFVPARIVCDYLLSDHLTSIRISHWGAAAKKLEHAEVIYPLNTPVEGKKVLIIDDVTDTGETLSTAITYIRGLGPEEIKTGVLQHKSVSPVVPDYYAEELTQWRWIVYPWAFHEDLTGFILSVMDDEPCSADLIRIRLESRYLLKQDKTAIGLVLADLVSAGEIIRSGSRFIKKNIPGSPRRSHDPACYIE